MPFTRAVDGLRGLPPVALAYQRIEVPVATKLLMVPLLQTNWFPEPLGAGVFVMVTIVLALVVLSQLIVLFKVCDA